ncbi:MAG: tRNA threonylcarbamoyladenosine dehydratase, partial [Selenomonadaceae bacterium]|nr:tRNA threonylcarbamoyladenosine dehydratase [Selenomonadaceae bacterium]
PIARIMRKKLKEYRIPHLKVVYSKEQPIAAKNGNPTETRAVPGSVSFVPSVAGLIMAGEIVRDLIA